MGTLRPGQRVRSLPGPPSRSPSSVWPNCAGRGGSSPAGVVLAPRVGHQGPGYRRGNEDGQHARGQQSKILSRDRGDQGHDGRQHDRTRGPQERLVRRRRGLRRGGLRRDCSQISPAGRPAAAPTSSSAVWVRARLHDRCHGVDRKPNGFLLWATWILYSGHWPTRPDGRSLMSCSLAMVRRSCPSRRGTT